MTYSQVDLQWFSAEDEGRTEDPSQVRLDKARKEGQVAKSQEFNSAVVLLFAVIVLFISCKSIFNKLLEVYIFYFSRIDEKDYFTPGFALVFFADFLAILLPVALTAVSGGIIANIIQNRGFIFSLAPIKPNFKKILPNIGNYLKRTLFSKLGVFNTLKSLGKVLIIAVVCFNMIRDDLPVILSMIHQRGAVAGCIGQIAAMAGKLLIFAAVFSLCVALPDYYFQRREFLEQRKMTKQELKQEMKDLEGDPEVKSQLERQKQAILRSSIPKAVAESDVVITNPTHYAVALKYERTIADSAPYVKTKGEDDIALTIRRVAKEKNIPIVENKPYARTLYTECKIGDIIPENYYQTISIIYANLEKFKNMQS